MLAVSTSRRTAEALLRNLKVLSAPPQLQLASEVSLPHPHCESAPLHAQAKTGDFVPTPANARASPYAGPEASFFSARY